MLDKSTLADRAHYDCDAGLQIKKIYIVEVVAVKELYNSFQGTHTRNRNGKISVSQDEGRGFEICNLLQST